MIRSMDDTVGPHFAMELRNQKASLAMEVEARRKAEMKTANDEKTAKELSKQLELDRHGAETSARLGRLAVMPVDLLPCNGGQA